MLTLGVCDEFAIFTHSTRNQLLDDINVVAKMQQSYSSTSKE